MGKTISIGAQSFEFIRENDCFFVDKTGLIKEWWENRDAVTLIARPRRFGKTLNLDMLNCFFSNKYEGRDDLFEGLSIWEEEKYRGLQGTYPVIFVSFAKVKDTTFSNARKSICHMITRLYNQYDFLLESGKLNEKEKEEYGKVSAHMDEYLAADSLNMLSDYLMRYYGRKVILLLDEYDTPLQEAYLHGYWQELVEFIRKLFNSTFKTNPYMERAVMTDITRVSKESIFSDMNNLTVVTTTSEKYRLQFGFTEEEVFDSLELMGMPEKKEEVKRWYDGFTFGSQKDIYNPWSIINFLEDKEFKPYWTNTSSNSLINLLIRRGNAQTKMIVEDLLKGVFLETEIDEEIVFDQLQKKKGAVWSMLLASGYLKVVGKQVSSETGITMYRLELTNQEVYVMFRSMILDWFSAEDVPYNDFIKALLLGDLKAMNRYMNRVALETFSYFDSGNKPSEKSEPERFPSVKAITMGLTEPNPSACFYHGFVLGLMVELQGEYRMTSNRESGFGRYDVMLEPYKKEKPAFVLEFKVHEPEDGASLEDTVQEARKQIVEKGYDQELQSRGFLQEQIRHYGFVFEGKKVLIG